MSILRVFTDSLTNHDNKFSSKKIITFISFNFTIAIAIADQFTKFKLNELVFTSFLLMAGGQSTLSVVSDKISSKLNGNSSKSTEVTTTKEITLNENIPAVK